MKDKLNLSRRKALLGSTAGAVAVAAWKTPILNSVILPAHAQMSVTGNFFGSASTGVVRNSLSPLERLVEPAYAGNDSELSTEYTVVISRNGEAGTTYEVGVHERTLYERGTIELQDIIYRGTASIGSVAELDVNENPCGVKTRDLDVEITADNGDSIDITFVDAGIDLSVPQAEGSLPDAICELAVADSYFAADISGIGETSHQQGRPDSIMDYFVEEAHAGFFPVEPGDSFAVELVGSRLQVTHRNSQHNVTRTGELSVLSGSGTLTATANPCSNNARDITMQIENVDATELELTLNFNNEGGPRTFTIPAAEIEQLPLDGGCD